jgi:psiF repeat
MGRSMWLTTLSAALVLGAAAVALPAAAENSQQAKMTSCNADATAKGLSGDDRKAFMKSCLSAKPSADSKPMNSQQAKMKSCNADANAKGLKGDARKTFMSGCLKGSTSP